MRNMSFSMTTGQIRAGTKTVTRRFGWNLLRPGDYVQPVKKAMGLKKGEKIEKLCPPIRIINVRKEPLNAITQEECIKEGFPNLTPEEFIKMLVDHYGLNGEHVVVNRIEFEYVQ